MKIRIYHPDEDKEKVFWLPTGFLFSRVGLYFAAKLCSRQARKDYDKALEALWKSDTDQALPDDLLTFDEITRAEKLKPPISEDQAREMLQALGESRYMMHGLPLISIEEASGFRMRIDL